MRSPRSFLALSWPLTLMPRGSLCGPTRSCGWSRPTATSSARTGPTAGRRTGLASLRYAPLPTRRWPGSRRRTSGAPSPGGSARAAADEAARLAKAIESAERSREADLARLAELERRQDEVEAEAQLATAGE